MNQRYPANAILLVLLLVAIVLTGSISGYFAFIGELDQKSETANWKTYSSSTYNFSLKYPNEWILEEFPQPDFAGRVIALKSPQTIKLLNERKISPGYSHDVVVSFWPTINNEYALGGSWIDQRQYKDLKDSLNDKASLFKRKIGDTMVAGQEAYEISIVGESSNYGVILEHGGIYELSFETTEKDPYDTTYRDESGPIQQMLSTFQFLNQ